MSNVVRFIFILLPPALVTGPFLADLFVSILAIFFVYESLTKKLWHYYKNPFVYLFIFFYLYIVIRSLTSSSPLLSLESSLFYCRYLFFALAIANVKSSISDKITLEISSPVDESYTL